MIKHDKLTHPSEFHSQTSHSDGLSHNDFPSKGWSVLLRNLFRQVERAVIWFLTPSHDPQICEKRDRKGNIYFRIYDSTTDESLTLYSEEEVRIWLDRRYSTKRTNKSIKPALPFLPFKLP